MVTPPFVAKPLHLGAFRALRLPARRVGDPGTLRQLSRSPRTVATPPWRDRGYVTQDAVPAVYLHEYTAAGLTVRGLVGALDISHRALAPSDRAVLPHEGIRPVQADDLADQMEEIAINPAPILLVHRATPAARALVRLVMAHAADHDFDDRREQHHRVWAITDPDTLRALSVALAPTQALIADGHHRYAAYLRMQQRHPGGAADRGLAMLVDQEETPLFLGPIHRCLVGVTLDDIAVAADTTGHLLQRANRETALSRMGPTGIAVTDGTAWASLSLRPDAPPADRAAVEIVHDDLLPALPRGPQSIDYLHSVERAMKSVRRSRRVALLMPAPDVDQVLRIAAAGRLLPEKATSFQPKPNIGVLMRSLHDR